MYGGFQMLPPKVPHTPQCPVVATVTDHKAKLFPCVSAAIPTLPKYSNFFWILGS